MLPQKTCEPIPKHYVYFCARLRVDDIDKQTGTRSTLVEAKYTIYLEITSGACVIAQTLAKMNE